MNNISIKCLKSETIESGVNYGQFLIDSLNPGQGITIGNQLRRILLGDLYGTAISAVRIAGVTHEFSTVLGVREDILEILLNLKGIVVKSKTKDTKFGRLKIQGPTVITADLIQLPSDLEIINKNHYIATISGPNNLEIEFKFEYGNGYKLADQTFSNKTENFLELDAIFMPVQKVDFKIENVYDNNNNISERLFLEIWTNGSISANEAIEASIKYVIDLFTSLLCPTPIEKVQEIQEIEEVQEPKINSSSINIEPYNNLAIEELQLSVRAYNCLKKAQINTVGELLQYSPDKLQELKNFGRKSADEVFAILRNKLGLSLIHI